MSMFSGSCNKKKTKVAFLNVSGRGWLGGFYYIRNLLYAIDQIEDCKIQPVLIVNDNSDKNLVKQVAPYAKIIRSNIVLRNNTSSKIINFIYPYRLWLFLKINRISVVSHSNITNPYIPIKKINWIPDFQHIHLPDMFTDEQIRARNTLFSNLIGYSDIILFSSNNALQDMKKFYNREVTTARVLSFVSPVSCDVVDDMSTKRNELVEKYNISEKFFYIPNQFWKHKNHIVVFQAVKILKDQGIDIQLVCSGSSSDYRDKNYCQSLLDYLSENKIEKNIRLLGLIDRDDVIFLIRFSLAVINPSLFEGWSTTIEEVKSIGHRVILSDINVHQEQDPPEAHYFDPNNANNLAEILADFWLEKEYGLNVKLEKQASAVLPGRIREFGTSYQDIVLEICNVER